MFVCSQISVSTCIFVMLKYYCEMVILVITIRSFIPHSHRIYKVFDCRISNPTVEASTSRFFFCSESQLLLFHLKNQKHFTHNLPAVYSYQHHLYQVIAKNSPGDTKAKNTGIFWSWYCTSMLLGNVFLYFYLG